jgi:hypothetical protein
MSLCVKVCNFGPPLNLRVPFILPPLYLCVVKEHAAPISEVIVVQHRFVALVAEVLQTVGAGHLIAALCLLNSHATFGAHL